MSHINENVPSSVTDAEMGLRSYTSEREHDLMAPRNPTTSSATSADCGESQAPWHATAAFSRIPSIIASFSCSVPVVPVMLVFSVLGAGESEDVPCDVIASTADVPSVTKSMLGNAVGEGLP